MPQINGLTALQRELCDQIWACETQQEVQALIAAMPRKLRDEAITLTNLIIVECIDEEVTGPEHCEDARRILVDFLDS